MIPPVRIGGKRIGDGEPTYVIAEMACAHEGDRERALRLVEAAALSGADAVQVQVFRTERLIAPSHPRFATVAALELSPGDWREILRRARGRSIHVWATVSDRESLALAVEEGVDALKLHASDASNPELIRAVGSSGKPVSLSCGGSSQDELVAAVRELRDCGASFLLLHGFQAYPTAIEEANLAFLRTLKSLHACPVGYQDHTDGTSELSRVLPLVAIGAGAHVLEKHFTLDRARGGVDHEAALDPGPLAEMVALVRAVDRAMGRSWVGALSAAELQYRRVFAKSIVAARPIAPGEPLRAEAVEFLRAAPGLAPAALERILDRCAIRRIERHQTILLADLAEPGVLARDRG